MEQEFTVLENKMVGRNLYKIRKIREKKAADVADHIGITEAAYTKYERGESKITIDLIQKVAEYLKVDPINLITSSTGHFIEIGSNSPAAGINNYNGVDEKLMVLVTKLIENQMAMNDKIMRLLEKQNQ
ncbi:helix-turn-helix domain-containing protein [Pseudoflavitalea rhizosphaerae]|uniref:helix-turn-helix domain-containing protein n=1 Tax=Pseudoflavitalea rhizosphaerae TaxID=1884793 RepID=UPI000F8E4729|nr:helix-turn-helix transcriptional regulator [Pseudoflavitalea rhizosphaerae]